MSKRVLRLVLSGSSLNELKSEAQNFIDEIDENNTTVDPRQASFDLPVVTAPHIPNQGESEAPAVISKQTIQAAAYQTEEKDSSGMPWDSRIHSESKAKTAKGIWRSRRGVEPAFVKQVESQILATAQPAAVPSPVSSTGSFAPPVPAAPAAFAPPPVPGPTAPEAAPFGPPPGMTAPMAPPPPMEVTFAHSPETFRKQNALVLARLVEQKKLTQDWIEGAKRHFGVKEIWEINDAQSDQLFQQFVDAGYLTKVN